MLHNLFLLVCINLSLCLTTEMLAENPFEATGELPVSYQGRFRALQPASELWLYDTYHSTHIKRSDLKAYNTTTTSPLELLWKMHLFGHKHWDEAPFFWIHYAVLKSLLDLPSNEDRFSYATLSNRLHSNPSTNLAALNSLITYEYATNYLSPKNRTKTSKIELTNLTEGLWVLNQQNKLKVIAAPNTPPWNFLSAGMVVTEEFDPISAIREHKRTSEELLELFQAMQIYADMENTHNIDTEFSNTFTHLAKQGKTPEEITKILESRHPLSQRLHKVGTTLKMLPSKYSEGEWISLHALKLKTYNPQTNNLVYVGNFTTYPDDVFENLRHEYLEIESAAHNLYFSETSKDSETEKHLAEASLRFSNTMRIGYGTIANHPYKKSVGKALTYPSSLQLKAETAYHRIPLVGFAILCYSIGLITLAIHTFLQHRPLLFWALVAFLIAFAFHSLALVLRIYILERPPVSNMFETVLYVPWIAMVIGFIFFSRSRHSLPLAAAGTASLILLVLLKLTHVDSRLENVQAVLDSQYWLSVHVLMVVGSYGIFAVCGILGHFYLIYAMRKDSSSQTIQLLAKSILHTMYIGVALLIPGTILGGVWAAESWGRFWDWDPKESWAFISACAYLLVIHAYTFRYIKDLGLAVGSIAGLMAISFTWYGVNYILGTGLHSYGFGKGGEIYYFLYLISEAIFLGVTTTKICLKKMIESNKLCRLK